jgi:hypothetical protein
MFKCQFQTYIIHYICTFCMFLIFSTFYVTTYSYRYIVYKMDSYQNQIIQSLKAFSDLYYKHITIVSDTSI